MKIFAIGALLITLPALIVALYALFTGRTFMLMAALASLLINTLPFVGAMFLLRNQADATDTGH